MIRNIFFVAFMSFSAAFAGSESIYTIENNKTIKIDVADSNGLIDLKFTLLRKLGLNQKLNSMPQVLVLEENNGFRCQVGKLSHGGSGYEPETGVIYQYFKVRVRWSPGADASGCLLEVVHPSLTQARAYLFMNY